MATAQAILSTILLAAMLPGCAGSSRREDDGSADAGEDVDRAGDGDADADDADADDADTDTGAAPTDHDSYVPDDLRPESAARLVVLGDSISAGQGASSHETTYSALLVENVDGEFPDEAETDLTSRFGAEVELVNVAAGGATTRDLPRQLGDLEEELGGPPAGHTIVVVTIGGNDLVRALASLQPPDGTVLDRAIEEIGDVAAWFDPERFPDGVSLYVADVYDPSDGVGSAPECFGGIQIPGLVEALETWRQRYVELATERGFAVVDALGHFRGHGFHYSEPDNQYYDAEDPTPWFYDCVHPNDRGHSELRRLFFEAIDRTYVAD
jgi:hypothetical protein